MNKWPSSRGQVMALLGHGPFAAYGPLAPARIDIDCDEVAGLLHFVEADASDTCHLAVQPRMVVAEQTSGRSR